MLTPCFHISLQCIGTWYIGTGITSSHVVRVMLELGCTPVTLLVRSELRDKQFDIPKKWFGECVCLLHVPVACVSTHVDQLTLFWVHRSSSTLALL